MVNDHKELIYLVISIIACVFIVTSSPLLIPVLPFLLVLVFALLLIFWAILAIRMNKQATHKHLGKAYFLIEKGPYEIIRHPIYAGILLFMFGSLQMQLTMWRFLAFILLLATILLKMTYEENVMHDKVPEYASYKKKTHKLIPYIF
jgi:protein-S-isoprenylcysteine O-methyltransferase Ste14